MSATRIEIKICGLTTPEAALACAAAGADAIGLVFHPASPRHLQPAQARAIAASLPPGVTRVGVFVEQSADEILRLAGFVGLDVAQLHGTPGRFPIEELARHGVRVVQRLHTAGAALLAQARALPPDAGVLVECGRGTLPGGNGVTWHWADATPLRGVRPFAIAGGLDADNVAQALAASGASAVDASSSLERAPGVKDLRKVEALVAAVRAAAATGQGPVFRAAPATDTLYCVSPVPS